MGWLAGMSSLGDSVAVGQQPSAWVGRPRGEGVGESGQGMEGVSLGLQQGRLVVGCVHRDAEWWELGHKGGPPLAFLEDWSG